MVCKFLTYQSYSTNRRQLSRVFHQHNILHTIYNIMLNYDVLIHHVRLV